MKVHYLRTTPFILGALLFEGITLLAVYPLNFGWGLKIIILLIALIVYSINQNFQSHKVSEKVKEKLVQGALRTIDQFKSMVPGQRLRSNIFFFNEKKRKYCIGYFYNMEADQDKDNEIPENLGCTGEAWRSKNQVFGDKIRIFEEGPYRIPRELLEKVPQDLEWICSTPLSNTDGSILAVLNFDGNRKLEHEQIKQIKEHCVKISAELKEILIKL